MDNADRADREDIAREQAIAAVRRRSKELAPIGFCYYCSEPVPAGSRFCDADCMMDFQDEEDARKRNGR